MKCFSIDLDGTLLNSLHQISEENMRVLTRLKEAGHTIIINTGRSYEDVIQFTEIQKLETPIICINGTILYSSTKDILFEASFSKEIIQEILPILQDIGLWIMVYTNQGGFPCRYPAIQDKSDDEIKPIFTNYDYGHIFENDEIKIYKIFALSRIDETAKIKEAMNKLSGKYPISIASSHPNNLEFTSLEANKGKALKRYQQIMNLPFAEIYAFGDGGNDIPQFKVATTSIAMKNAPKYVQKEANFVTKTNDENGFAYAVEKLLKF